jgi:hypothetical protein
MTRESTLKNKGPMFFSEDGELLALIPLHKWLLISASVLIFLVLPLLFIWSSMGIIHPHHQGQSNIYADARLDSDSDYYNHSFKEHKQLVHLS